MKRTYWIMLGLLGASSLGFQASGNESAPVAGWARTSDYTLDGTLEPDEVPALAGDVDSFTNDHSIAGSEFSPDTSKLNVDGPIRLPRGIVVSENCLRPDQENAGSNPVPMYSRDLPLHPPKRLSANSIGEKSPYELVQYTKPAGTQPGSANRNSQPSPSTNEKANASAPEAGPSLKSTIRQTLTANSRRPLTTQSNTPGDILLMTLAYGADGKVYQSQSSVSDQKDKSGPKGNYIYSIGTLCWNYPCGGKTLLRTDGQRVYAKVGVGYQHRPASFLALLAMSNIMPSYELRISGSAYTIAHLIASEKASVGKGMNMSMSLVGISFYSEPKESWKNEMGETWNIERMVTEELNRPIDQGSNDVTDWLLGLTSAVKLYEEEGKSLRGPMALAKKQIGIYQDFVLSVQNENNLWHPKFFLFKGTSSNVYETLFASGHILRWLIVSLSDEQLNDPQIQKSVASLAATINRIPANQAAGLMTDRQVEALGVSLQALSIYNQRVFGQDAPEETPESKTAEKKDSVVKR